jgi:hypothetical protein
MMYDLGARSSREDSKVYRGHRDGAFPVRVIYYKGTQLIVKLKLARSESVVTSNAYVQDMLS